MCSSVRRAPDLTPKGGLYGNSSQSHLVLGAEIMLQRLVCEGSDHPQDSGDHSEKIKVAF